MNSEQVCLKWNNFSFNITKNIDDLWKDESLVDVSLISDGQCIQAHKVILSASSPLFKSLFASNPCQHPVIILQDVRFSDLISIISFIYKGEVNILEENLATLLQAAKTLQIRGLSDSVDKDHLNRCNANKNNDTQNEHLERERPTKKRKIDTTNDVMKVEDPPETIIPKEEPKNDNFPIDFLGSASDEEDIKTEDIILHERAKEILDSDLAPSDDTSHLENISSFPCPFCKRIYTNWGFRRRHIKAVHSINLCCNICDDNQMNYTLIQWICHMLSDHEFNSTDIQKMVSIYKEAKIVLQDNADLDPLN